MLFSINPSLPPKTDFFELERACQKEFLNFVHYSQQGDFKDPIDGKTKQMLPTSTNFLALSPKYIKFFMMRRSAEYRRLIRGDGRKLDKKIDVEIRIETIRKLLDQTQIKIEDPCPINHKLTLYDKTYILELGLTAK